MTNLRDAEKYLYNKLKEKYNYLEFDILVMINYSYTYFNCYDFRININIKSKDILTIYKRLRILDIKSLDRILSHIDIELSKNEFNLFIYEFSNNEVSKS